MHESKKWKWSRSVVSDSAHHGLQPTRLLCPWNFPGKSTGVGCHCLLQVCTSSQGITSIAHSLVKYIEVHRVSIIERQKATLVANLSSIGQKRSNYPESTYNNQTFHSQTLTPQQGSDIFKMLLSYFLVYPFHCCHRPKMSCTPTWEIWACN